MDVTKASGMAQMLMNLESYLKKKNIITPKSEQAFENIRGELTPLSDSGRWGYSTTKSEYIEFRKVKEKKAGEINIKLFGKFKVKKDQSNDLIIEEMNFDFETYRLNGEPVQRWHFDKAEPNCHEPIYHLHSGGSWNSTVERPKELLDGPRWLCKPMDLILVCEYIIAIFFPDDWKKIKCCPIWKAMVHDSENCFLKPYYETISEYFDKQQPKKTLLESMWQSVEK